MSAPERVTRDDIEAKLREIRGEVDDTARTAKPVALAVGVAVAVGVVGLAYLMGRRRGRRARTFVEVRRI